MTDAPAPKPLTVERLEEILAGTAGVTPGPWERVELPEGTPNVRETLVLLVEDGREVTTVHWDRGTGCSAHRDAAHIANCDPQTVSSIITELLKLRAETRNG